MPTFFMPFFGWHYNRSETAETIGIERDDLMYATSELLDYMRGRRDSLEGITAEVVGRDEIASRTYGQNFFSATEIRHMLDVRALYDQVFIVRNVAFFFLFALVLGMYLIKENPFFLLSRCAREVLTGFWVIMMVMAGVIAINFDRSWTIFHHIFFRGDAANYWRLTPFEDLMINMYPLEFFLNISIFFAGLVTIFSAVIIIIASLYLRYSAPLPGFKALLYCGFCFGLLSQFSAW
jgi:integral membrane protein (TIGR01906 family)